MIIKIEVSVADKIEYIHTWMTVLDVVSMNRQAEAIFRRYDEKTGVCLCCEALFEPLSSVAVRYGLDLDRLMEDLRDVSA
jgi:hypothetical protein